MPVAEAPRTVKGTEAAMDERGRTKIAGLVLLGLGLAFYLMFAIGETAGGDISGVQHFLPAVILGALMYVAWRRPLAAGIVLLVLAVPLGALYIAVLVVRDLPLTWALWIALPPVVTGLLLVRAGRHEHRPRGT
jgi:peptidoglycan/LPS O-acetylase OafA/YrhL